MKGIIFKDLYDNFGVWKNLASYIFSVGIVLLVSLFSRSEYFYGLMVFMTALCGSAAIESSTEQDEISNFNRLLITFPVTKNEIIRAKYILALCFLGVANVFSFLILLLYVYAYRALTFTQALPYWLIGVCASLILTAFSYVIYSVFGKRRGTIFYCIIVALLACAYGALWSLSRIGIIGAAAGWNVPVILGISFPVSVLLFFLSYVFVIWLYKKRYA